MCTDMETNQEVDGGECLSQGGMSKCQLTCPLSDTQNSGSTHEGASDSFCRGGGTDMHMGGFTSVLVSNSGSVECLLLFFSEWNLDSGSKFSAACVGVFCLGLLIEFCTRLRRELFKQVCALDIRLPVTLVYSYMYAAVLFCAPAENDKTATSIRAMSSRHAGNIGILAHVSRNDVQHRALCNDSNGPDYRTRIFQ